MKYYIYSIYDNEMALWSPMYLQRTHKLAIKGVKDMIAERSQKDPNYTYDLTIYTLGEYDDELQWNPIKEFLKKPLEIERLEKVLVDTIEEADNGEKR